MSADRLVMEKIDREKLRVEAAPVDARHKEDYLELLDHAENICNGGGGSLENVAKAMGAQIRVFVKAQLEMAEMCAKCRSVPRDWRSMLLAMKWPVALFASVAVFSPNFTRIADIVEKVLK